MAIGCRREFIISLVTEDIVEAALASVGRHPLAEGSAEFELKGGLSTSASAKAGPHAIPRSSPLRTHMTLTTHVMALLIPRWQCQESPRQQSAWSAALS